MKKQADQYFQVITTEHENSADILLYGYIGQDDRWDEDRKEERITDIAFIQKLNELSSRYQRINIRINSPGGSVYHGDAIIAAIRNCQSEIHTYNDGMAASIAAVIWLAGHERHMSAHAKLMIHSTATFVFGTAQDLRQVADQLDTFDEASAAVIAAATGMSEEEVTSQFFDYEDHWYTAKDAVGMGLIDKVEEYDVKESMKDVEQMTYSEILRHFTQREDKEAQNFLQWIGKRISNMLQLSPATQLNFPNKKTEEMTIQELQDSLKNGDIRIEDVVQILKDKGYGIEPPKSEVQQLTASIADTVQASVEEAVKPLNEKIGALEAMVEQIGAAPGAGEEKTPKPDQPSAKEAWLQQTGAENDAFTEAVKKGESITFTD